MTNFTTPQGSTPKDGKNGKPAGPGGYKSKLDEILAKAGNNNPIAAAQARNTGKTAQAGQPASSAPVSQQPAQAPAPAAQPATPPAAAPNITPQPQPQAPQTPQDRLKQILAMAGQTTAQRAQTQATANTGQTGSNSTVNAAAAIQKYFNALVQDPRKILMLSVDFGTGSPEDVYFKAYADAQNNMYWDLFGEDISYVIPSSIAGAYTLFDNYYRGVPHNTVMQELANAAIAAEAVV